MGKARITKADILSFIKKHQVLVAFMVIIMSFGMMFLLALIAPSKPESELEQTDAADDRSYELSFNESEYEFDCNTSDGKYCQTRIVNGTYSKYDGISVEGDFYSDCSTNGAEFECEIKGRLYDYYAVENFNLSLLPNTMEEIFTISLEEGDYFGETYISKKITVKYNLSDRDKKLIEAAQKTWLKEEQEREAKKKEEEKNQVSNNSSNSSNSSSSSSSNSSSNSDSNTNYSNQTYEWKQLEANGSCASNAKLCYAIDSSLGYASYNYGTVKGRIVNNSGKKASYIMLTLDIYNSAGAKVGDCYDTTSGLPAGDTWAFEAYCTGWASESVIKNLDITWY